MNNSNLHIEDALNGASPGNIIDGSRYAVVRRPLQRLIGRQAGRTLLARGGTIGLWHWSSAQLEAAGIQRAAADQVIAARELFGRHRLRLRPLANCPEQVLETIPAGLGHLETEVLLAVALDARLRSIGTILLAQGGADGAAVQPRDVFVPLVRLNARSFVLVHNHPSGVTAPSKADVVMTNIIAKMGHVLDVRLLDHLIVAGTEFSAFSQLGLLPLPEELESLEVGHGQ